MPRQDIDPVELASSDSFPASDPPSWTGAHVASPPHASSDTDDRRAVEAEPGSSAGQALASTRSRK